VLDDGRLTDGQGNVVDFKNTVIILTSNLGSDLAGAIEERRDITDEQKRELVESTVMEAVRKSFRPEFINRLDEQVVFHRLERDQMRSIVDIQLRHFAARLAERELTLEITDAAKDLLVARGYDPQYGARPLKRTIQRLLENELAKRLLGGAYAPGDTIVIDAGDGALTYDQKLLN